MTSFESKTVRIAHSSERVFELLSDLSIEVSPIGSITFRIIDREPNKTIKFEAENSPLPLNLWIQLVSTGENETASRITVKAELNPFIKPMVSKPLQEGVDKMADMLVILPYE